MVSINDIARLAGTSKSTVSRVLNGQSNVTPAVQARVLAVIQETGFVPNQAARNMVLQRSFTVGVIIPDTFNMFQRQLFSHIEHHLEHLGYHTHFFFAKDSYRDEPSFLRRLKSEKLDGVIVIHEVTSASFYEHLARANIPAVLCTFDREDSDLVSVRIDDEQGAFDAVRSLIALGHRRIGLLRGREATFSDLRARGFVRALGSIGLEAEDEDVVAVDAYTMDAGREGMDALLYRDRNLTAVFAVTDDLALGAIRSAANHLRRVPQDLAIVGFDDIDLSAFLCPSLTTIQQPMEDMGKLTAFTLRGLMAGVVPTERKILLPHQLIVRESSGPPAV